MRGARNNAEGETGPFFGGGSSAPESPAGSDGPAGAGGLASVLDPDLYLEEDDDEGLAVDEEDDDLDDGGGAS